MLQHKHKHNLLVSGMFQFKSASNSKQPLLQLRPHHNSPLHRGGKCQSRLHHLRCLATVLVLVDGVLLLNRCQRNHKRRRQLAAIHGMHHQLR